MFNFLGVPVMKNLNRFEEEENDLTRLSLWVGSPRRETQSLPYLPTPSLFAPFLNLNASPLSVPYSSQNPNPLSVPSSSQNPNPNSETLSVPSSSVGNNNPENSSKVNVNGAKPNADVPKTRASRRSRRSRRPPKGIAKIRSDTIPPPFPWATDERAIIHSHKYLVENNISIITGKVQCKKCDQEFVMCLNMEEKLTELRNYIRKKRVNMNDRAPLVWTNPVLPKCVHCGRENSAKPVLVNIKKKAINWLFLFLTQTVACCTLEQLRYFCEYTNNHRTGAKDRLVYLTYMTLHQQLFP